MWDRSAVCHLQTVSPVGMQKTPPGWAFYTRKWLDTPRNRNWWLFAVLFIFLIRETSKLVMGNKSICLTLPSPHKRAMPVHIWAYFRSELFSVFFLNLPDFQCPLPGKEVGSEDLSPGVRPCCLLCGQPGLPFNLLNWNLLSLCNEGNLYPH